LSPLSYAASIILLKKQTLEGDVFSIAFTQSAIIAGLCFPFLALDFVLPNNTEATLLIGLSTANAIAFYAFILALKLMPATSLATIDNTALIWAAIFGFYIFNEVPTPEFWIGSSLIIAACVLTTLNKPNTQK